MSLVAVVMTGENVTGYKASLVVTVMRGKSVTGYKVPLVATVMTVESVTVCDSHGMPCDCVFS